MINRVFLLVLDSFGVGEMPDADMFGDKGSNTLKSVTTSKHLNIPNLRKLGLFNIDGLFLEKYKNPIGVYGKMAEMSNGKDSTVGHWEIAGVVSKCPLPTFPNGFDKEIMDKINKAWNNIGYLCNKPYSGTEVIKDYGKEHLKTGKLIVYTSADSVFQIAAHKSIVSIEKLYEYCRIARKLLVGKYGVGRVIARPFEDEYPFIRSTERQDFSIDCSKRNMLDYLSERGFEVVSIGKIEALFAGRGITRAIETHNNHEVCEKLSNEVLKNYKGLCFANLVDFDMLFGHRNDVDGYAMALSQFDEFLTKFIPNLKNDDLLIITADHGCDPLTASTDHSREYVPVLLYGNQIKNDVNLNIQNSFANLGKTILEIFSIPNSLDGESFLSKITKYN